MRHFILLSFVVISWTLSAKDKVYDKLSLLYQNDREKCMELCKKYIAKDEKNAIPYYFQSVIYFEKSKEARTVKGMYQQIYRSVSSAINFEKKANDQQREKVEWNTHVNNVWERSSKIVNRLEKDGDSDLALALNKRLDLVPSYSVLMDQKYSLANDNLKEALNFEGTKIYFGKPTGQEYIAAEIVVENNLLTLINQHRSRLGLPALLLNENLAAAARYHAYDQATEGYFDHNTKDFVDGKWEDICGAFDRIEKFAPQQANGEIIAAGKASAESTLKTWLESKDHKAIIENPNSESIGIGFQMNEKSPMKYYWVVVTGN